MNAAFGDAIRAGARRVSDGGALEPEVAAPEDAIERHPTAFLRR